MGSAFAVSTAMLWGMEARPVRVEVSLSSGLPGIAIVGRPDPAVSEARSRVRCALRSSGFKVPRESITVNLSPGELRKSGTAFDLPIAVAILAATRQIPVAGLDACLVVGELSLAGEVLPVRGLMAYADLARRQGKCLVAPRGRIVELGEGLRGRFVSSLAQLRAPVGEAGEEMAAVVPEPLSGADVPDFSEVAGQRLAKRALLVAAAGRLGVLMVGPPGIGKTMLARCVPGILPELSEEEHYETMLVHSVAGVDDAGVVARMRPFRSPHHTASAASLVGGGRPVKPGEISLAHNGVLFLDELGEFSRSALQSLRQPMEEKVVRIARVEGSYEFPCDFQFVAASNPCPCGHLGDPSGSCRCTEAAIASYRAKLAGPLGDRIDVVVGLERPSASELFGSGEGAWDTAGMRSKVGAARERASWRRARREHAVPAGRGSSKVLRMLQECELAGPALRAFEGLARAQGLSVRAMVSVLRIARAIADVEDCAEVGEGHVLEAVGMRDRGVVS